MSPKKRGVKFKTRKIPLTARWKAKFHRWAKGFWSDVRGKNKAKSSGDRKESFQFCPMCERTRPLWVADFGQCEEHPESCGCCLYGLHGTPPQGGGRQRKKARPSQFKPGDPGRQGYRTEKEQHADRQAEYQAEIVEQASQETQEQGSEGATAIESSGGADSGDAGGSDGGADSGGGEE